MKRVNELVAAVRNRYPKDPFFLEFEDSLIDAGKLGCYQSYNDALMCLDNASWSILKEKALKYFGTERKGQTKQPFFNLLNEAFAYEYLLKSGFTDIRFVLEDGKKKNPEKRPDISYLVERETKYCEVKSIGISEAEIAHRSGPIGHADTTGYFELTFGFFNKLRIDTNYARTQINAVNGRGIVFVLVQFDDFTNDNFKKYCAQLSGFCSIEKDVVFKIGHKGHDIIQSLDLSSHEKVSATSRTPN